MLEKSYEFLRILVPKNSEESLRILEKDQESLMILEDSQKQKKGYAAFLSNRSQEG